MFEVSKYMAAKAAERARKRLQEEHRNRIISLNAVNELQQIMARFPFDQKLSVEHDGFAGTVRGYYKTLEGKYGLVLQQTGTRVVHVYSEKWFKGMENAKRF